ncbi:hypothetical protein CGMCC3_g10083 [Colletotrichum fructicola]|uniref:Uncharacterized protein n=1 Tax=Colletotrichum fructicola (strain Nara gc5) TaxID=1213859 RepID=A0A7J6IXY1_COLFN|nr:uncharacterized protein CGMCC3_g10083 [Colletotrichum fructicola]KAE9573703.1 hypothetical protein CGMCC3_g10083 [Colletotrichum fructicola]KAF4413427.1 hypothetical protein CFRS1_v009140 [Colletotrichum fructicola]KAF4481966.1 hypothetical protein CGGC5_v008892 [Colletotrichum fructicola Nara gc5]
MEEAITGAEATMAPEDNKAPRATAAPEKSRTPATTDTLTTTTNTLSSPAKTGSSPVRDGSQDQRRKVSLSKYGKNRTWRGPGKLLVVPIHVTGYLTWNRWAATNQIKSTVKTWQIEV